MKFFYFLVIYLIAVLRLNLPPDSIEYNFLSDKEHGIVADLKAKFIYSDTVADWIYTDFVFLKFSCSKRLKIRLLGVPFRAWELFEKDVENCRSL